MSPLFLEIHSVRAIVQSPLYKSSALYYFILHFFLICKLHAPNYYPLIRIIYKFQIKLKMPPLLYTFLFSFTLEWNSIIHLLVGLQCKHKLSGREKNMEGAPFLRVCWAVVAVAGDKHTLSVPSAGRHKQPLVTSSMAATDFLVRQARRGA